MTAIAIMGQGYELGHVRRVLVVAPASVVGVWAAELESFADYPYSIGLMQGTAAQKLRALEGMGDTGLQVAVCNYETVWRDAIYDALVKYAPDMIIADESQRIKSPTAKQSKAMHKLGDRARYKLILTGTPVQNNAMDLWSQYKFLDKSVLGDNFYKFRQRFAIMGGFNGKQVVGVKDGDVLARLIHSIALRVTKAEALDLPEKVFVRRPVELSPREKRLYDKLKRDSFAELDNGETVTADMITTKLLRLSQLTGGFTRDDSGNVVQIGDSKLRALGDIVDDYVVDGGHKLVVFARFTAEIDAICRLLDSMDVRYGCITGATPMSRRAGIVAEFQQGDSMVMVGQIQAAGTGITLHAASAAVYYSLTYNYADYAQSTDRIHRIGQKDKCTYIHLICPGTVDTAVMRALGRKEDLAKALVDNWREFFR